MDETRLRTIEQLEEFLKATPHVAFTAHRQGAVGEDQRYEHISRLLTRFDYAHRSKRERGVVLAYLRHTSGYARAQLTRLVARWSANRAARRPLVKLYRPPAAPFARKYNALDVELLVEMDRAHEDVCGPAIAPNTAITSLTLQLLSNVASKPTGPPRAMNPKKIVFLM